MSNQSNLKYAFQNRFWMMLTVIIACGLAAGILGGIIAQTYVGADFFSALSGEVNLSNLNVNNSGLVIRDAKKVVVNQDVKVAETINNIRPVLVSVFKEISTSTTREIQKPDYYKLDEPAFIGLIITSDGWVVALAPSEVKVDFKFKNYVVVTSDRQLYKIDKLADLHNQSGDPLVFHLASATNLPVKKIIPRPELTLGETLLVVNNLNSVWPTTLSSLVKAPTVSNSDSLSARLSLSISSNDELKNSFVFDLAGDLAALIAENQEIIPAFSYDSSWATLSQKEVPGSPLLGVNYLDLSAIKTVAVPLIKGAWLYPTVNQPAVEKDSPAQAAGLKAGDVITWVNNQEIDANNDLADILSAYQADDKVILTYWRSGAEKEVEIKLGEMK
jgi:hypothetical protein